MSVLDAATTRTRSSFEDRSKEGESSDGTRIIAMWTGSRWWSAKGEVNPVRWELEIRKKKTDKLLKKLPGSERPEDGH